MTVLLDHTAQNRDFGNHMSIIRTVPELESALSGARPAFVPTMGALHQGHLALIRRAAEVARPVLVSIFVNPTQFGPGEDFAKYPRMLDADVSAAVSAGADLVFAPDAATMYPPGQAILPPPLPAVATSPGLEDAFRPGHFAGVCQIVARLFDLVQPSIAVFGEKDYQQLLVVQAIVRQEGDRWPNLAIIPHPTVREPDGLAMSSRNKYLTPDQRDCALGLSRALEAANILRFDFAEREMREILEFHDLQIDYALVRDPTTLMPLESTTRPARALIAARIGNVRLIDNAPVGADWR